MSPSPDRRANIKHTPQAAAMTPELRKTLMDEQNRLAQLRARCSNGQTIPQSNPEQPNDGDHWMDNGELMQLRDGPTEPESLVEGLKRPQYLQVDDDDIYIAAYNPAESVVDNGLVYRLEQQQISHTPRGIPLVPRLSPVQSPPLRMDVAVLMGFLCRPWDDPAVGTWAYGRLRLRTTSKEPSMLKNITGKTATALSIRRYRSG